MSGGLNLLIHWETVIPYFPLNSPVLAVELAIAGGTHLIEGSTAPALRTPAPALSSITRAWKSIRNYSIKTGWDEDWPFDADPVSDKPRSGRNAMAAPMEEAAKPNHQPTLALPNG